MRLLYVILFSILSLTTIEASGQSIDQRFARLLKEKRDSIRNSPTLISKATMARMGMESDSFAKAIYDSLLLSAVGVSGARLADSTDSVRRWAEQTFLGITDTTQMLDAYARKTAIAAKQDTGTVTPIRLGGTGAATAQAALNALAVPAGNSGKILGSNGTDMVFVTMPTSVGSVYSPDTSITIAPISGTGSLVALSTNFGRRNAWTVPQTFTTLTADTLHGKIPLTDIYPAPTTGTVTSITASSPLTGGTITGSGTIGIPAATSSVNGYLTSTDWTTFNNKGSGTVTSVGLTLPTWLSTSTSTITTAGTFSVTATTGQTANRFLATPNGSTGAVSLRAIVAADLPATYVTTVTATSPITSSGGATPAIGFDFSVANTWRATQTFSTVPTFTAGIGSATATTQSASDNSTKVATTAYSDAAITAERSAAATLTNKRIEYRTTTVASYTTSVAINADNVDRVVDTAQSGNLLLAAPTGTPSEGQELIYTITAASGTISLTYNSIFVASTNIPVLPTGTAATTYRTIKMKFIYNQRAAKWFIVAKDTW